MLKGVEVVLVAGAAEAMKFAVIVPVPLIVAVVVADVALFIEIELLEVQLLNL